MLVSSTVSVLGKKLIFFGALLFLLGILQGLVLDQYVNPRQALSAHLAAVQSGMALMVFGAIWCNVQLTEKLLRASYLLSVYSMYAVWFAISLSAFVGASEALPMAGKGYSASATEELIVTLFVGTGGLAGVIGTGLIAYGLYKNLRTDDG